MALRINRGLQYLGRFFGFLILASVLALIIKLTVWETNYYSTKNGAVRSVNPAVITALETSAHPDETPPSEEELENHQVSATAPRYLDIPRLDIHARVVAFSANRNIMPSPDNIYDAAWYSGSGYPGSVSHGAILISGLSGGDTLPGIFANLSSLEEGDEIILETGNNEKYYYSVKELSFISLAEANDKLPALQQNLDDLETITLISSKKSNNTDTESTIIALRATRS